MQSSAPAQNSAGVAGWGAQNGIGDLDATDATGPAARLARIGADENASPTSGCASIERTQAEKVATQAEAAE